MTLSKLKFNLKLAAALVSVVSAGAYISMHGSSNQISSPEVAQVRPDASPWDAILMSTTGLGDPDPAVVIFFDPACPHCAELNEELKKSPMPLRVKWVPVAVMSAKSVELATNILASSDPLTAFEANEAAVKEGSTSTLLPPVVDASVSKAKADVRANTAAFTALNQDSIPTIVTVDKSGKLIIQTGAVPLDAFLSIYGKFKA